MGAVSGHVPTRGQPLHSHNPHVPQAHMMGNANPHMMQPNMMMTPQSAMHMQMQQQMLQQQLFQQQVYMQQMQRRMHRMSLGPTSGRSRLHRHIYSSSSPSNLSNRWRPRRLSLEIRQLLLMTYLVEHERAIWVHVPVWLSQRA